MLGGDGQKDVWWPIRWKGVSRILGFSALCVGKFVCFVVAHYLRDCSNVPNDDVMFGGFDGSYHVCDEKFVWAVILRGGVFDMFEEEVDTN